jgi:hypothetical protein
VGGAQGLDKSLQSLLNSHSECAIQIGRICHRPFVASKPEQDTSIWLALRNPAFVGLWFPSVVSGVCVATHDTAATWLMNGLGASPLLLSLIATAASLPFFLFTLPAGALADLSNRRNLLIAVYLWLAVAAGLLAFCCLDGHGSKPLDVSARDRLGRHQLDGVGFRTLGRWTTSYARLGSWPDECCPPDGLAR